MGRHFVEDSVSALSFPSSNNSSPSTSNSNAIEPFIRAFCVCSSLTILWWLVFGQFNTVMVDPLKIFWVLTNSTYLGMWTAVILFYYFSPHLAGEYFWTRCAWVWRAMGSEIVPSRPRQIAVVCQSAAKSAPLSLAMCAKRQRFTMRAEIWSRAMRKKSVDDVSDSRKEGLRNNGAIGRKRAPLRHPFIDSIGILLTVSARSAEAKRKQYSAERKVVYFYSSFGSVPPVVPHADWWRYLERKCRFDSLWWSGIMQNIYLLVAHRLQLAEDGALFEQGGFIRPTNHFAMFTDFDEIMS